MKLNVGNKNSFKNTNAKYSCSYCNEKGKIDNILTFWPFYVNLGYILNGHLLCVNTCLVLLVHLFAVIWYDRNRRDTRNLEKEIHRNTNEIIQMKLYK